MSAHKEGLKPWDFCYFSGSFSCQMVKSDQADCSFLHTNTFPNILLRRWCRKATVLPPDVEINMILIFGFCFIVSECVQIMSFVYSSKSWLSSLAISNRYGVTIECINLLKTINCFTVNKHFNFNMVYWPSVRQPVISRTWCTLISAVHSSPLNICRCKTFFFAHFLEIL